MSTSCKNFPNSKKYEKFEKFTYLPKGRIKIKEVERNGI